MEQGIQRFEFEGRALRCLVEGGAEWFNAADACAHLDLDNVTMAMERLDEDEKSKKIQPSVQLNGVAPVAPQWFVTEPGLYALVLASRKPEAKAFKRWVTHEVLPAIRRTGSYSAAPALATREQRIASALLEAHAALAEKDAEIAELTPPAQAWRQLADCAGDVNLQTAGKALGLPPNLWIAWLRRQGILFYRGRNLVARQDHLDAGRFVQRVRVSDGEEFIQTLVTPKGISYFGERRPTDLRAPRRALPRHPGGRLPTPENGAQP